MFTLDRIRVWNEETREMLEPMTIPEMIRNAHNLAVIHGEHIPPNSDRCGHLVFMRNTGIFDHQSKILRHPIEIFAGDLIIHSTEPYVYRARMGTDGCWLAASVIPTILGMRLNMIHHPTIVGNAFEDKELMSKGEVE